MSADGGDVVYAIEYLKQLTCISAVMTLRFRRGVIMIIPSSAVPKSHAVNFTKRTLLRTVIQGGGVPVIENDSWTVFSLGIFSFVRFR